MSSRWVHAQADEGKAEESPPLGADAPASESTSKDDDTSDGAADEEIADSTADDDAAADDDANDDAAGDEAPEEPRADEDAAAVEPPLPEPDEATSDESVAGYDGNFFIRSADGQHRLGIDGLFQFRYTLTGDDPGNGAPFDVDDSFSIPRARVGMGGHLFGEDLSFRLQIGMDDGNASMLDYFVDYRFHDQVYLRLGQDRRMYSRSFLTIIPRTQFANRSPVQGALGTTRDIGLAIHNNAFSPPGEPKAFAYGVGFFNGTGSGLAFDGTDFENSPEQFLPSVNFRAAYSTPGMIGYSASDLEGGGPRIGVGLGGLADFDAAGTNDGFLRATADVMFKFSGFSATAAAFVVTQQNGPDYLDRTEPSIGGYLQGGYVIADLVEPIARFGIIERPPSQNDAMEAAGGVNLFFIGHNLRWVTEGAYELEQTPAGALNDFSFRTQAQVGF